MQRISSRFLALIVGICGHLGAQPVIHRIESQGRTIWTAGQSEPLQVSAGQSLTLHGSGFGDGPEVDYSKILFGNTRAIERDLPMYEGYVNLLEQTFHENSKKWDSWPKEIDSWSPTKINFRVPETASKGPLVVSVQKRITQNASLLDPILPHRVMDPLTERIPKFEYDSDFVSSIGTQTTSEPIAATISNPSFATLYSDGEKAYWGYDYNIGLTHNVKGMDWTNLMKGKLTDPYTGKLAKPETLFGGIRAIAGEVPRVATERFFYDPYPVPMPVKPLGFVQPLHRGWSTPTGYLGYVYNEAKNVYTAKVESKIGMNCAACHANRVTFEAAPGKTVTKVFVGIPNPHWSMKWTVVGGIHGVVGKESGETVDKGPLIYNIPEGATENAIVQGSDVNTRYANDNFFAPTVIPPITRHTPVRRALGRTELIVGFEGSYIHAQEPDGEIGALRADSLKALTVYMSTLDGEHETLARLGLYRWMKENELEAEIDGVTEGQFMQTGPSQYPKLSARIERGQAIFKRDCASCHTDNFGTYSDENMIRLSEVGTYFSPSIFHRETQSIRTAILRDLYWLEQRGLLHDGHVKSMEDLVDPERCSEGSALYKSYYEITPATFKVSKGNEHQELATRRHRYFVDVPWDSKNLYWDYQGMRKKFGIAEFGSKFPISIPAAPHPWCAGAKDEISDLVAYLMTL